GRMPKMLPNVTGSLQRLSLNFTENRQGEPGNWKKNIGRKNQNASGKWPGERLSITAKGPRQLQNSSANFGKTGLNGRGKAPKPRQNAIAKGLKPPLNAKESTTRISAN